MVNKKSISSVDLAAIEKVFPKGRIQQIYHYDKQLILQIYDKSKDLIKVYPGKFISQTSDKTPPQNPSGFCMYLRKKLKGKTIKSVEQYQSQRVLTLIFDEYKLIIELFSRGNIIFTNLSNQILNTLIRQPWKDRVIKNKETYIYPADQTNWKTITREKFYEIISSSDKKNIATTLATEIGLGGTFANELCYRAKIDPKSKNHENLYEKLEKIKLELSNPKGYIYEKEISPIKLSSMDIIEEEKSFLSSLDKIKPDKIISPYKQKLQAVEKTIERQKESIKKLHEDIEIYSKQGDLIYDKYNELNQLKNYIEKVQENKEWSEIKQDLLKLPKIKEVNLKTKKIKIIF